MSHVDANLTYFETKLLQWKCTMCEHSMVDHRKHIVSCSIDEQQFKQVEEQMHAIMRS